MEALTQEYLLECITYNINTGIFTWKDRPSHHFQKYSVYVWWNSRFSNKTTGSVDKRGYSTICIDNKPYYTHRLAFLYVEGYFPENFVDHIDGNPTNNKWNNLREVTQLCNMQNCKLSINNKSGVNGIFWDKKYNKWQSNIRVMNKQKCLGRFINFDDAVKSRYLEELNNPNWTCSTKSIAYEYLKQNNLLNNLG